MAIKVIAPNVCCRVMPYIIMLASAVFSIIGIIGLFSRNVSSWWLLLGLGLYVLGAVVIEWVERNTVTCNSN